MRNLSHDWYFLDEGFFPIFLAITAFFGKGLNSKFAPVSHSFSEINWGKVALANFLDGLIDLMKISLREISLKHSFPLLWIISLKNKLNDSLILGEYDHLSCDFEPKLEIEIQSLLRVSQASARKCDFVGPPQRHFLSHCLVQNLCGRLLLLPPSQQLHHLLARA